MNWQYIIVVTESNLLFLKRKIYKLIHVSQLDYLMPNYFLSSVSIHALLTISTSHNTTLSDPTSIH